MPDYEYKGTNTEVTKKVAKKTTTKDKDNKKKEEPKGKVCFSVCFLKISTRPIDYNVPVFTS